MLGKAQREHTLGADAYTPIYTHTHTLQAASRLHNGIETPQHNVCGRMYFMGVVCLCVVLCVISAARLTVDIIIIAHHTKSAHLRHKHHVRQSRPQTRNWSRWNWLLVNIRIEWEVTASHLSAPLTWAREHPQIQYRTHRNGSIISAKGVVNHPKGGISRDQEITDILKRFPIWKESKEFRTYIHAIFHQYLSTNKRFINVIHYHKWLQIFSMFCETKQGRRFYCSCSDGVGGCIVSVCLPHKTCSSYNTRPHLAWRTGYLYAQSRARSLCM